MATIASCLSLIKAHVRCRVILSTSLLQSAATSVTQIRPLRQTALPLSSWTAQSPKRATGAKKTVGVILCGIGRAGRIHFNGIRQNLSRCSLKYIVDRPNANVVVEGQTFGVAEYVRSQLEEHNLEGVKLISGEDYDKALNDPEVDAVVVATPTHTHEHFVKGALRVGKAVFCEKPIAANIKDTAYAYDLAAHVGKPLFCAFQRRFDPGIGSIYQEVKEGKVGKIWQIRATTRISPRTPIEYIKISQGIFHDCAVHEIDTICWIAGEEPVGVFAHGVAVDSEYQAINGTDSVVIVLKFKSGVLATIDIDRHCCYGYDQRLEVYGEKGMLICGNPPQDTIMHFHTEGSIATPTYFRYTQRHKLAYQKELDHFLDCVLDPSKPLAVKRENALLSSRVANACERSFKEGKMVPLEPEPLPHTELLDFINDS